jgi:CP family cyanate transporter-like MFS transporter
MSKTSKFGALGVVALILITVVLRPPVASIGPLLYEIVSDLQLDSVLTGILASAPVFCFGVGAFASPWLVKRFGVNHAMFIVLAVLAGAILLRLSFGYVGLLAGTIAAGLSIAVANVLLPTVVRLAFPKAVPLVTGSYTTLLALSASFAAWVAVPSSEALGGWRNALLIWALPAVLAAILWFPKTRGQEPHVPQGAQAAAAEKRAVLRSPIAWSIVGFFGIQSLGFYAVLGWLPSMLISIGLSPAEAGSYLGLATAIGIPSGLLLAPFIGRFKSLAWWVAGTSSLTTIGYALLAWVIWQSLQPTWALLDQQGLLLACVFIGVGQAATFPLALSLISTRASTTAQTTQLSAMSQGWGYLLAAAGTFAVGVIGASSGGWLAGVVVLGCLTVMQIAIGFYSGRPGLIAAK